MTEFFRDLARLAVPAFVVSTMLNVGLTQRPTKILEYLANRRYLARMVVVNLIVVPALMVFALEMVELDIAYESGLLLFGMCAGAPFLIRLTQASSNDLALGATVLLVLMAATVVIVPVLLPILIDGVEVDAWPITRSMLTRLVAPMITGMIVAEATTSLGTALQPWVARFSTVALYTLIASTLIGFSATLNDLALWKAIAVAVPVLAVAFLVGFMMGDGQNNLKDIGGLSTAQRGAPAALIIATANFDDTGVFLIVNLMNMIGIIGLLSVAKTLSRQNKVELEPHGADAMQRNSTSMIRPVG